MMHDMMHPHAHRKNRKRKEKQKKQRQFVKSCHIFQQKKLHNTKQSVNKRGDLQFLSFTVQQYHLKLKLSGPDDVIHVKAAHTKQIQK
ncbi:hypothetical protein KUF71_022800 [Frankliniella fusca]|uniref:Uncharacterized protein n=1 Tax=Frankliniella fusca TaxID=407009 RepID=A0AAE1H1Q7_9NEOP|nr:hypothetical protein KUF71_022800 [Frankliniella fusca]